MCSTSHVPVSHFSPPRIIRQHSRVRKSQPHSHTFGKNLELQTFPLFSGISSFQTIDHEDDSQNEPYYREVEPPVRRPPPPEGPEAGGRENRRNPETEETGGSNRKSKSGCVLEFWGNETRSGILSSNALPELRDGMCTVIFKGNPGDVLIIKWNSYKLK